jgi:hypothetical protein
MLSITHQHQKSNQSLGQVVTKFVVKASCFVAAECLLNMAGLDTLADYYEFIAGESQVEIISHQAAVPAALFNQRSITSG